MMKRYILGVLSIMLSITSCGDNYYIENDLHGMWQVTSIKRFSTDEVVEPQGWLYYSFQRTMIMLSNIHLEVPNSLDRYIAHFDIVADSIGMGNFRVYTTGEGNNINYEHKVPLETLKKFGLYQDYTMFFMQQSKQKLILTSDSACIELRRY